MHQEHSYPTSLVESLGNMCCGASKPCSYQNEYTQQIVADRKVIRQSKFPVIYTLPEKH